MDPTELAAAPETSTRLEAEHHELRARREKAPAIGDELAEVLSLSQSIVAELDLERVFELVATHARRLVGAELVVVPMLNEARDAYTYAAASGSYAEDVLGTTFPTSIGMCGWVLRNRRPLLFGAGSTSWLDDRTTWEEGQQSAVLVPLLGRNGIIGGLSALGRESGGSFTQHDLELLTLFANQVSAAIENARLFREVRREIDERKAAERALQESQGLLRQILDALPLSIFWKDRDCRFVGCNRVLANQLGLDDPARIAGLSDADFPALAREVDAYRRDDLEVMRTAQAKLHIQEPLQLPDGTRRDIDTSKVPLRDASGEVNGMLGVFDDVTERRRAEALLARSEQRLRESQKVARLGSWEVDFATGRLEWSDESYALFDVARSELEPTLDYLTEHVHPDDRALVAIELARITSGDARPFRRLLRVTNDSGRAWTMEASAIVRCDAEGRPSGIFGTAQDVTTRELVEARLRESEEFIRSILDTVDEGFIVVDRDYRIVTANDAYCRNLGLARADVIGQTCFSTSHGQPLRCSCSDVDCAVQRAFATGQPQASAHEHRDREGRRHVVETKAYPMKDRDGAVRSVLETINDVTERHMLEEERLKTQKLQSIGTLAGGIAHDFNNLLQAVFGHIAMAKLRADRPGEVLEILERSETSLRQAVGLTSQLLTFARGGKPVRRPTDLRPVIENAARFSLSGARSALRLAVAADLWPGEVDEGQIAQVIQNVVLNADQAMPEGGEIIVRAINVPEGSGPLPRGLAAGDYVRVTVQDRGGGIPDAVLGRIFDPYFTTKAAGTGLGLATSYSIVRNHGGVIEVATELGVGSTFTIYLPARHSGRREAPKAEERASAATRGRVLVMDDEEILRRVTAQLVHSLGHEVEVARDGQEALDLYRAALEAGRRFDVVILDLTVRGGMGGAEAMRRLCELDPTVTAIVSSGYSDDATMADHLTQGFKAFLQKPYGLQALNQAIGALLPHPKT
jgi:PAS domain S-box-containing protein